MKSPWEELEVRPTTFAIVIAVLSGTIPATVIGLLRLAKWFSE
jgi:hypothetical protein